MGILLFTGSTLNPMTSAMFPVSPRTLRRLPDNFPPPCKTSPATPPIGLPSSPWTPWAMPKRRSILSPVLLSMSCRRKMSRIFKPNRMPTAWYLPGIIRPTRPATWPGTGSFSAMTRTGEVIAATQNTYEKAGLAAATGYLFRVLSVDNDTNDSNAAAVTGVTLLPNPVNPTADPQSGYVDLTWDGTTPFAICQALCRL